MPDRNPDYSVVDWMAVKLEAVRERVTDSRISQRWEDWAQQDLHLSERIARGLGKTAEVAAMGLGLASDVAVFVAEVVAHGPEATEESAKPAEQKHKAGSGILSVFGADDWNY